MKFSVYDNGPILKASQYTNQLGLQIIFEEVRNATVLVIT